jgi:hypothetical protein
MEKMYIIRKYVMAKSAQDAIRKEKGHPVDDAWVDEEWKKNNPVISKPPLGFAN